MENAPEIVKVCVESIKRNCGNHEVVIITEENYKEFVSIPQWAEEKKNASIISRTHYSDILRLAVLAEHGGMWLDATFLCTESIEEYFEYPLWSIKRPGYNKLSVASGAFANYSWCCTYEQRWVFAVLRDYLLHYWETNDMLIDYLVLDYLIVLAQRKNEKIAEMFEQIAPNNPNCDELLRIMGEEYDEGKWNEIKKDTPLFKLSWKMDFPRERNGKETFYAKLLNGELS